MGRDRALAAPSSYKGDRGRRERGGERDQGRERVRGRGHAYSSSAALRAVRKIKSPGQGRSQKPPDVSAQSPLPCGVVVGGETRSAHSAPRGASACRDVPGHRVKRGVREQMLPVRLASCQLREGATPALPPGTPVRPGHGPDSSQRRV